MAKAAPFSAEHLYSWIIEKQAGLTDQQHFQRVLLAFSGGLDSTALLLAARQVQEQLSIPMLAVHVNHGIQAEAGHWAEHCRDVCQQLDMPFKLLQAEVNNEHRKGLEARAREARYTALTSIASSGDLLLTGQHADDQSETLLLHLLRGSGVEGLAAIHPLRTWNKGWLGRPLLGIRREQLVEYVSAQGHRWSEDPSNQDLSLRRNFLRHKVFPLVTEVWPQAVTSLNQSAEHCKDALENLAELAQIDIQRLQVSALDRQLHRLLLTPLLQLPVRRQRLILRSWIRQQGRQTPGVHKLNSFLQQLATAANDAQCELCWQGYRMASHSQYLYLNAENPSHHPDIETMEWLQKSDWHGRLSVEKAAEFNFDNYSISSRKGGESINLATRLGTHTLKKLFQESGIPPWLRGSIPLLHQGKKLVAVGDLWLDENFQQQLKQSGSTLTWEPTNNQWVALRNAILKLSEPIQEALK
ncbi:MAG: tRNA lysidine(34) synthetase TilS [Xanthomonadales bacterium]|nr:tRNA lysidine(34) synthetase TilS [Xanthomonadales bacterium]